MKEYFVLLVLLTGLLLAVLGIMKKFSPLLLLLVGLLLIISGIIFNPSFVDKYVIKDILSDPAGVTKVLSYQLYTLTVGCLVFFISVLLLNRKYAKIAILPFFLIYLLLVHGIYVNKVYPDNIFLKPSKLTKLWPVLLGENLILTDYQPKSLLVVENRQVLRARYPAIDVHFHLKSMENLSAEELIRAMDACGIDKVVNLDGASGDFERYTRDFKNKYPSRFLMFVILRLDKVDRQPDFAKNQITLLEKAVKMGAQGLKVTKDLGLGIKNNSGKLVPVDDPRLDPIWSKAGELGIPVLIHIADPTAFFQPVDKFNERYEELKEFPGWSYYKPHFPTKETLLTQRENLLKKHPKTIFIGAHMGMNAENLHYVGYLLDHYPNYYVDISSVLHELGRQPYTAREFFIRYQDRILFGTDGGYALGTNDWSAERYFRTYIEFLETSNEYFEYPLWGINKQGRWHIYGINLPDEVLKKIYYKNAEKVILGKSEQKKKAD